MMTNVLAQTWITRWAILLVVLTSCGACASSGRIVYSKPGVIPAQQARDESECAQLSTAAAPRAIGPALNIERDAVNRCMERRGYSVEQSWR
jgi:hypothetical protein